MGVWVCGCVGVWVCRFVSLFTMVAPAPSWGVFLATIPFWICVGIMWVWFYTLASSDPVLAPNSLNFEDVIPEWVYRGTLSEEDIETSRRGRFGTAISVLGFFILVEGAKMFVPGSLNPHYEDDITREDGSFEEEVPDEEMTVRV